MTDKLDNLSRIDDKPTVTLEKSRKYINTKRKINGICTALCKETKDYKPEKTIENIQAYLDFKDKLDRILYSEISNHVFSLDMSTRGIFATNVEKLLLYSLDDEVEITEDCRKMIIKIYDHFQLALNQIENANTIFASSIEDAKINLYEEIKGIEKEYISILGIFAAIILAFVGGITFSSSVLQNIAGISIYRLLMVIDLLALVLINAIYMLIKFIFVINNKSTDMLKVKRINIVCFLLASAIIIAWFFNALSLADFMAQVLPWCK